MTIDASLLLLDASVDLDENHVNPTSLTRNGDGAVALDLRETGAKGLSAIMTMPTQPTTYQDTLTAYIEESEALDRQWRRVGSFEPEEAFLRILRDVTATTAFVAADQTTPRVLTATTDTATGTIWKIDQALFTLNGIGDIYIIMQDANDVYATEGDILTATGGTGIATQGVAGLAFRDPISICRFTAQQRYVRLNAAVSSGGNWLRTAVALNGHSFKTL